MKIAEYELVQDNYSAPKLVRERTKTYNGKKISTPYDVYDFCKAIKMDKLCEERVYLMCYDNQMMPIGFFLIGKGCVNSCTVSVRSIAQRTLLSGAVSTMIIHNHPSGDITPSSEDKALTEKLVKLGKTLEVPLLDSVIISKYGCYSMSENNDVSF